MSSEYSLLPSVDKLLTEQKIQHLINSYSRESILTLIREYLDELRHVISNGGKVPKTNQIIESLTNEATMIWKAWPNNVINATGVIIHTNLGRAPLSIDAKKAVLDTINGYTDLEMDIIKGKRGSRQTHIERLLKQLTGSEAALVVNNNASGLLLGLTTLAKGGEVIISRGEAVEIGGGFRIPDLLQQSGAKLIEVGTTNRTYIQDYENAITDKTKALLKVHTSNFKVLGFTHSVETSHLAKLGQKQSIPVLHDLGSGCLIETSNYGLIHEVTPQEILKSGADLVFFSGDKLLGGPQAGIILGQKDLINSLSKHPLSRAIRIDKLNLSALSATLLHYINGEAVTKIPIWQMISASEQEIKTRARQWQKQIGSKSSLIDTYSTIGGGSLPTETLSTWAVSINHDQSFNEPHELMARLRLNYPPIIGRIEKGQVILDPRTVLHNEDDDLINGILDIL